MVNPTTVWSKSRENRTYASASSSRSSQRTMNRSGATGVSGPVSALVWLMDSRNTPSSQPTVAAPRHGSENTPQ